MAFNPALGALVPGGGELWVILIIILVLFGGSKLPGLAKGLGQSIKEFKKASKDEEPEAKAPEAKSAEAKKNEPANTPGSGSN